MVGINSDVLVNQLSKGGGKTKRTGYESGEYEMVCCVCVDGNGAAVLSSGHLRERSRDIVGIPSFSLVGGPEEPSRMQLRMLCPPAVCSGESPGLQLSPVLL